jgi:hypothetical protein
VASWIAIHNEYSSDIKLPPVRIEYGLAESINESWYRSWALPGADGTWGFGKKSEIDPDSLHPASKAPVQPLLLDWKLLVEDKASYDHEYESRTRVDTPYRFYPKHVESAEDQRSRMLNAVNLVKEPGRTVVVFSHGGPVTHLYETITGNGWHVHGESSYCCYSIYRHTEESSWETIAVNESKYLHEVVTKERHV